MECVEFIQKISNGGTGGLNCLSGFNGGFSGDISLSPGTSCETSGVIGWLDGVIVIGLGSGEETFLGGDVGLSSGDVIVVTLKTG